MKVRFEGKYDNNRTIKEEDYLIVINEGKILMENILGKISIPKYKSIIKSDIKFNNFNYLGELNNNGVFTAEGNFKVINEELFKVIGIKEVGSVLGEEIFSIIGRANQVLHWDRTHKFCGKCGSLMSNKEDERAKICLNCNYVAYPVICPAIIVAIKKDDKILLAHNKGFKNNIYSIIAGFVDAGETFEEAVEREIYEEVGIKVKNIKYHSNQPWSFPNSLMIGFTAEYESGEINVDRKEIVDANWYSKDSLPNLPNKLSIARKIIDGYCRGDF